MVEEEEKIKKIADLRAKLEKRVEEMETELAGLRVLLSFIDDALLARGFKRAKIEKPVSPPTLEYETSIPLKTVAGDHLATVHIAEDIMQIVLAEDKIFNINTPPFTSFLVGKVLKKMREKDWEVARTGQITPEKTLTYNIVRDGDVIRELIVKNVKPERIRELKSSIQWTLEKMYEKMTQTG